MNDKPGRNEPCHCGSSKKYKKCCGTTASTANSPGGEQTGRQAHRDSVESLHVRNNGPDIVSTNFWETTMAKMGGFTVSSNAGAMRILLPESLGKAVPEMQTGKEVIVSRGVIAGMSIDGIDFLFEDGSANPYSATTPARVCGLLPRVGDRFVVSVWTKGPADTAVCQLRLPAKYRHVRKVPCRRAWEPEDETRQLY